MAMLTLLLLSCWAPEVVAPDDPGAPQDPPLAPLPQGWPTPPFTAWTTRAPTSIVGPGGVPLALLSRAGVRIEVIQVLPARVRLRCDGCDGQAAGVEGWLQADAIAWPGGPALPDGHPLGRALELRAAWARGAELPAPVDPDALCALLDGGYSISGPGEPATWLSRPGQPATWGQGAVTLTLAREADRWLPPVLAGAPTPAPGACAFTPAVGTSASPG